MQQDREALTCT